MSNADNSKRQGSTRTRQLSEKVRVFDDQTRKELKRKRLDALERDNWVEDVADDDDDEYDPDEDGSDDELFLGEQKKTKKRGNAKGPKKKTRRGGDQFRDDTKGSKSFEEIVEDEQYYKYPSWVPNYESARAKPSTLPPRKFCYLTGLVGKYKCPVTGDYLATLEAYETHKETRLKGLI